MLIGAFRRDGKRSWPVIFVGVYNILLMILFLFGMATQVGSEGFGFLPLMALTLPWSLPLDWLWTHSVLTDINIFGGGLADTFFCIFVVHNVLAATVNSCILYFLLMRRKRKQAEDEAWEQARRSR